MEVARARLAEELDADGERLAEELGTDGDRLAEELGRLAGELGPAAAGIQTAAVAGARFLVKDRAAATGSRRALLIAADCVSAAFFASVFPPAR
jgi:hypothetical protein